MKWFVARFLLSLCVLGTVLLGQTPCPSTPLFLTPGSLPPIPGQVHQTVTCIQGTPPAGESTPALGSGTSMQGRSSGGSTVTLPALLLWSARLSLDAGQQASLKAMLSDQQGSADTLRRNLAQAQAALDAAKKATSVDYEIDRLSGDLGAVMGQLAAVEAKTFVKFYALLTPDQKQKFDKLSTPPAGSAGH